MSRVQLALLLSAALLPRAADAGAWLAPEGHGQIVVSGTASSAGRAFDGSGNLQGTPRYDKQELQALMEYGVTDWLTARRIGIVRVHGQVLSIAKKSIAVASADR